jgi:hypothetical protein
MKPLNISNRRIAPRSSWHPRSGFRGGKLNSVLLASLAFALAAPAQPITATWQRQALGQTFNCPVRPNATYGWPNNNNWSQAQVIGDPCSDGSSVIQQPSNWSITGAPNGTNYNVILGSLGGAPANLDMNATLNQLTLQSDGGLTIQWGSSLTAKTIELQSDNGIQFGGGGGGGPSVTVTAGGMLLKSGGTGTNNMAVPFFDYGGTIQVNSGTLSLNGGGGGFDGTFVVNAGAALDLTGGSSPSWFGQWDGSGGGTVRFGSGNISATPGLTLNLPGSLLQWSGGQLAGTTTNINTVTLAGSGPNYLAGGFHNLGVVHHTNAVTLAINWGSGHFENLPAGSYNFESDAGITTGFCCGATPYFNNYGLMRKTGGTGTNTIGVTFNNLGGTVQVDRGTLSLSAGGSSSNGTLNVATGAVLDLTGGSNPTWAGQINGSGAGQVLLSGGTISTAPSLTLNLPAGLLQWTGGQFAGTTINSNSVTIAGLSGVYAGGVFYNYGTVHHTNTATLAVNWNSHFENEAGGTYILENNGSLAPGYCCGGTPYFSNFGLLRKSGGAGTSTLGIYLNNQNGVIQVDSGMLSLAAGGGSSNGTFNVAAGAVLDLTGGSNPNWSGKMNGSGAGTVSLNSGTISTDSGLTLNLPGGLFQWTGGTFGGTTINSNTVTVAGGGTVFVGGGFYNYGLMRHTGTATLAVNWNSHFENFAGGIYSLDGDVSLVTGACCGGTPTFNNYGLLRKTSGTGTAALVSGGFNFANQGGSVEVDSGTLNIGSYVQGGGAFTVMLGGRGAGQTGRLSVNGGASLNGPLNVQLANGFAPAPGEQFQILSSGGLGGAFSTLNVPAGIAVTYSNNSVFLVVTGTVPAQIVGPALDDSNFTFSFGTVSNQSYTVQRNDNLNTADWTFYTNLTGNGSLMQVFAPVTNVPQSFFRVRQP